MSSKNILEIGGNTMIFNGGDPLPGCPSSFEEANTWADKANEEKDEFNEPCWSFDCGFKLDFDGSLIRINSRFYPPKTHYGATWDGSVSLMCGEEEISRKDFDCPTLDELRIAVEAYVKELSRNIRSKL